MNPGILLALICDFYAQITQLQSENVELKSRVAELESASDAPETDAPGSG